MKTIVIDLKNDKFDIELRDLLLIISHVLKKTYHEVFFAKTLNLSSEQHTFLLELVEKRKNGCPLAKILGYKEFYGIDFITNENTLDPRPETEFIIDLAKEFFPNFNNKYLILDLGCGTGCISLTILSIFNNSSAVLVDIVADTLSVAQQNAKICYVFDRCNFIQSNWFENVHQKFDIIVSNPPYVENGFNLDKQTSFDPKIALFAGENGLDAYKKIVPNCSNYLNESGMMFVEIGAGQAESISKMLPHNIKLIKIQKDLAGIDRIMVFKKNV